MTPDYEYQQPESNLRPTTPKKQEFRQPKQRHPNSLGAVWLKTNNRGVEYLSMKITLDNKEYNLKCFKNSEKQSEEDSRPSYIIFESKGILKERDGNK